MTTSDDESRKTVFCSDSNFFGHVTHVDERGRERGERLYSLAGLFLQDLFSRMDDGRAQRLDMCLLLTLLNQSQGSIPDISSQPSMEANWKLLSKISRIALLEGIAIALGSNRSLY